MGSKVFKNIKKIAFTALMCSIFAAVFSEYAFAAETCYKSTELNKIIYKAGLDICNNNAEETKFCVDNVSKVVDKTGKIGKDVDPAILQNFINSYHSTCQQNENNGPSAPANCTFSPVLNCGQITNATYKTWLQEWIGIFKNNGIILNENAAKKYGQSKPVEEKTKNDACGSGILSYITCPFLKILSIGSDSMYFVLKGELTLNPELLNPKKEDKADSGIYTAWKTFRNLANTLFIILFLIIIASYISGYGLNQYNIKKLLPKIIVSVILINLSFFICQLMLDISNIVGSSLKTFFENLSLKSASEGAAAHIGGIGSNIFLLLSSALALNKVRTAQWTAVSLRSVILLFLVLIVLILIIITVIMLIRKAAVILLTVLSPLMFALMIFPSGDNLFKIWKKAFTACLMLYPLIAVLFGASELASSIIISADKNIFTQLIGQLIRVLPLIVAPGLIQSTMASLPLVGQMVNRYANQFKNWGNKVSKGSKWNQALVNSKQIKHDDFRIKKLKDRQAKNGNLGVANAFELKSLEDKQNRKIDSMTSGISEQEAAGFMSDIGLSDDEKKKNAQSGKYGEFIRQQSILGENIENITAASMLSYSKAGSLSIDDANSGLEYLKKSKNFSENMLNSTGSKIMDNAYNTGRFDTYAHLKGMQNRDANFANSNFDKTNTQNDIEDFIQNYGSVETVSKINPKAIEVGSDGYNAFRKAAKFSANATQVSDNIKKAMLSKNTSANTQNALNEVIK